MQDNNHVFIRVSGFGLTVVPFAPFRIARGTAGPNTLDVSYFAQDGERFARVIADEAGGYSSKIDQNTRSLYDVVEIFPSPRLSQWCIETSVFWCDWPATYELASTHFPAEATIVDLLGADFERIYIQSVQQVPALKGMVAPGQRVINLDETAATIDLEYRYEGEVWFQRHQRVSFPMHPLIVTVQSPRRIANTACAAARIVSQSITIFLEEGS